LGKEQKETADDADKRGYSRRGSIRTIRAYPRYPRLLILFGCGRRPRWVFLVTMQLWLIRHAVAVERDEFDGPDAERPLTDKGRKRFRECCDWLADRSVTPDAVLSSPLVRAAETAAILARAFGLKKTSLGFTDLLAPGLELKALLQFVREQTGECIALVGHEPDFSECLSQLVGGGAFAFGKGFIAAVEFNSELAIGSGRLRWLVGPKLRAG
jgi:phosphohistidine phosphatase